MATEFYDTGEEFVANDYYTGLEERLVINEEHINTVYECRVNAENIMNDPNETVENRHMAEYALIGMTSSAANDIYEKQLSGVLDITNIDTKHGWDGIDETNGEPYEYKPTKITSGNPLTANVNINDESENKINNISPQKEGYNNSEANFVIAIINKDTSEFICIYKFKEYILYRSRMDKLETYTSRKVYGTNIKKCIELSKKYNEKYYSWHNPLPLDFMRKAAVNYEDFHNLPRGSSSMDDIRNSSAGIQGWALAGREGA